jgi:hypothetical protein
MSFPILQHCPIVYADVFYHFTNACTTPKRCLALEFLVNNGADVNIKHKYDSTPLGILVQKAVALILPRY